MNESQPRYKAEAPISQIPGWREVTASNNRLIRTAQATLALIPLLNPAEYDLEFGEATVYPTAPGLRRKKETNPAVRINIPPLEALTAPLAIKRVMKDLGIKDSDTVVTEIALHPEGSITPCEFTIKPKNIEKGQVGVIFGRDGNPEVEIIAHPYYGRGRLMLGEEEDFDMSYRPRALSYEGSFVKRFYNDDLELVNKLERHPILTEIYTQAADWLTSLAEWRRKTPTTQ